MPSVDCLITGAGGWLGQGLLRGLIGGLEDSPSDVLRIDASRIRGLFYNDAETMCLGRQETIEVVVGDIRANAVRERFLRDSKNAVLIHAAGVIHPKRISDFYTINFDSSVSLLQQAAESGIRRAIFISSNSPCGVNPNRLHRFDEQSPFRPYMNYGRSKMRMEQETRIIAERFGMSLVHIRAPWFYGPAQPARQDEFFRMIRDGRGPIIGDGLNFRSMVYIDNLVRGVLLACTAETPRPVYWVADQRPYTMVEIIDTVENLLETEFRQTCKKTRLRLPGFVSEVGLYGDLVLQALGLYNQKIHVLSEMNKTIACSISLAQQDLGYFPQVDLKEGMRRSLRWVFANRGRL